MEEKYKTPVLRVESENNETTQCGQY
eukprot:SAG11_NODE_11456_length_759_cov_2.377273_1_plen_25_part_01